LLRGLSFEDVKFRKHPVQFVKLRLKRALPVYHFLPLVYQRLSLLRDKCFGFG
jgi:hypothetical protein